MEMVFYLYVVDRDGHLVGVTSLRQLLLSKPDLALGEIMQKSVIKVHLDTDQEEVARQASRYDLLAIPVVDDHNRLAGIVTVDDIIDVVKEEAAEDLFKMAGTSESELLYEERTLAVARLRLPSLLVSLAGLVVTGWLLYTFQSRFPETLLLLAFVPAIMGLSGSIGNQASAVAVRALAGGRLASGEASLATFLVRQLRVGVVLGAACGALAGAVALFVQRGPALGLVVALAPALDRGRVARRRPRADAGGASGYRPGGRLGPAARGPRRRRRDPHLLRARLGAAASAGGLIADAFASSSPSSRRPPGDARTRPRGVRRDRPGVLDAGDRAARMRHAARARRGGARGVATRTRLQRRRGLLARRAGARRGGSRPVRRELRRPPFVRARRARRGAGARRERAGADS